jgi:hypothetical protein
VNVPDNIDPNKPILLHFEPAQPKHPQTAKEKMTAYAHAKADIEISRDSINPQSFFRKGDTIQINFHDDARRALSGLYKVKRVGANGVEYRKMFAHEKVIHIAKHKARQWWQRAKV